MRTRWFSRRQPGQTVVLVAIMLLVLVAVIGLSVDVGKAYGRQRTDQTAANAAALAGMSYHVEGKLSANDSSSGVLDAIHRSLQANNLPEDRYELRREGIYARDPEKATVWAVYLWKNGNTFMIADNVGGRVPEQVDAIGVAIIEPVETHFARIVGRDTLTVNATGYAAICDSLRYIVPFMFDANQYLRETEFDANSDWLDPFPWGGDDAHIEIDLSLQGEQGSLGWIDYNAGENAGSSDMAARIRGEESPTEEGVWVEGPIQDTRGNAAQKNGIFEWYEDDQHNDTGDWAQVNTGARPDDEVEAALDWHINHSDPGNYVEDESDWTTLLFPVYSSANEDYGVPATGREQCNGGGRHRECSPADTYGIFGDDNGENAGRNKQFKIFTLAKFRLKSYEFRQSNPYMRLVFLGFATPDDMKTACTVGSGSALSNP